MRIAPCTGCFGCWTKTPGQCVQHDDANAIPEAIVSSDLMVLLTSVTFGGYSSQLKKALDRSIPILLPFFGRYDGEVHHLPRYQRYPALVAIGVMDEPNERAERTFRALVERNAINMHVPSHEAVVVALGEDRDRTGRAFAAALARATSTALPSAVAPAGCGGHEAITTEVPS